MQMETRPLDAGPGDSRQADARSASVLVVVVLLLALVAGLFVAQNIQGSAQGNMQTDVMPVSQQVFGTVPPPPTPGPPSNLIHFMPIVFNQPNIIAPLVAQPSFVNQ